MGLALGEELDVTVAQPVKVYPGKSALLVDLRPRSVDAGLYVVQMGVTQHPSSTYTYITDGVSRATPIPLGEFHSPVVCCRDLGAYLDAYESFRILVKNDDDIAHYYAALVWYVAPRAPQRRR